VSRSKIRGAAEWLLSGAGSSRERRELHSAVPAALPRLWGGLVVGSGGGAEEEEEDDDEEEEQDDGEEEESDGEDCDAGGDEDGDDGRPGAARSGEVDDEEVEGSGIKSALRELDEAMEVHDALLWTLRLWGPQEAPP
jgi:hypothetical protein